MKTQFSLIHMYPKLIRILGDLGAGLESFDASQSHVDDDINRCFSVIQNHLDRHAQLKTEQKKSKLMPEWFSPDKRNTWKLRDHFKCTKIVRI